MPVIISEFSTKSREDQLNELLAKASESRELEFKEQPYLDTREDKREFLKDVTAFANTIGGHLIIGMATDDDGVANRIVPI